TSPATAHVGARCPHHCPRGDGRALGRPAARSSASQLCPRREIIPVVGLCLARKPALPPPTWGQMSSPRPTWGRPALGRPAERSSASQLCPRRENISVVGLCLARKPALPLPTWGQMSSPPPTWGRPPSAVRPSAARLASFVPDEKTSRLSVFVSQENHLYHGPRGDGRPRPSRRAQLGNFERVSTERRRERARNLLPRSPSFVTCSRSPGSVRTKLPSPRWRQTSPPPSVMPGPPAAPVGTLADSHPSANGTRSFLR